MSDKKAVVLLSGGLDSSTLVFQLLFEEFEVMALGVNYGQRHERELQAAKQIAQTAGVPLTLIELGSALSPVFARAQSSQVGSMQAVPHGHYAAENMKTTIVPNRNMMLIS